VVAVVIVVNALSGDADRAAAIPARAPAAATPAKPAAAPAAARSTTAATPTTGSTPAAGGAIASWPRGKVGWTVVLATTSSRAAAEQRARGLIARGVKAGVLDTSRFTIDASGASFVVFTGRYPSQDRAVSAESRLGGRAPASVFVAQVSPR
jgi:septal ring-binding cell division protein DamX